MPKPVLSDSLFNAGDVAEAVLSEASLQITNENLGVTDISSSFSPSSGIGWNAGNFYKFNGFVFISVLITKASTPSESEVLATITDSNNRPVSDFYFPVSGYQGDSAERIKFEPGGSIKVQTPVNPSPTSWYVTLNGFYRVN